MTQLWRLSPLTVNEWVGPLTVTINGTPTTNYQVGFAESGTDPAAWENPVEHPDGTVAGLGIVVGTGSTHPLTAGRVYRIWVQIDLGTSEPVLDDVGMVAAQ